MSVKQVKCMEKTLLNAVRGVQCPFITQNYHRTTKATHFNNADYYSRFNKRVCIVIRKKNFKKESKIKNTAGWRKSSDRMAPIPDLNRSNMTPNDGRNVLHSTLIVLSIVCMSVNEIRLPKVVTSLRTKDLHKSGLISFTDTILGHSLYDRG